MFWLFEKDNKLLLRVLRTIERKNGKHGIDQSDKIGSRDCYHWGTVLINVIAALFRTNKRKLRQPPIFLFLTFFPLFSFSFPSFYNICIHLSCHVTKYTCTRIVSSLPCRFDYSIITITTGCFARNIQSTRLTASFFLSIFLSPRTKGKKYAKNP